MAIDEKLALEDAEVNRVFPAKAGGPLVRRIGPEAMRRVVRAEGQGVLTEAAKGYWEDQDKRFPHIRARATGERRVFEGFGDGKRGDDNPRRMRLVGGKWMVRVGTGKWEEEKATGEKKAPGDRSQEPSEKQMITAVLSWCRGTMVAQGKGMTQEELEARVKADDPIWSKHPLEFRMMKRLPDNAWKVGNHEWDMAFLHLPNEQLTPDA